MTAWWLSGRHVLTMYSTNPDGEIEGKRPGGIGVAWRVAGRADALHSDVEAGEEHSQGSTGRRRCNVEGRGAGGVGAWVGALGGVVQKGQLCLGRLHISPAGAQTGIECLWAREVAVNPGLGEGWERC